MQGEEGWSYGMTLNISATGLLFQSARTLSPEAAMHIEVVLPGDEDASVRVISRGAVARVSPSAKTGDDHLIAATLDASDLVRTERALR